MGNREGTPSPGLDKILSADGAPTSRQVNDWATKGWLRPDVVRVRRDGRPYWSWSPTEQKVAVAMGRLVRAGLRPEAAEKVARHPTWGPVVLGPGVIISLFAIGELEGRTGAVA